MPDSNERRRFFRIEDILTISYRELSGSLEGSVEVDAVHELTVAIDSLRVANSDVAAALDLISQRLARLESKLVDNAAETDEWLLENVNVANVSACGVAFPLDVQLSPGTQLELDLFLRPTTRHVRTAARVVACDAHPDGGWLARVEYVDISEAAQEVLLQHLIKRQGEMLRARANG